MELNNVTNDVLNVIDSYGFKQEGAYNLRLNGMAVCHGDSRHIQIVKKEDQAGDRHPYQRRSEERTGTHSGRDDGSRSGRRIQ